jgi:hypothetical protein
MTTHKDVDKFMCVLYWFFAFWIMTPYSLVHFINVSEELAVLKMKVAFCSKIELKLKKKLNSMVFVR